MKLLITGGHLAPALAIIEKLRENPSVQMVFVGRKYALEHEKTLSLEYKEIEKRGLKFVPLQTGRFTRVFSMRTLKSLSKVPLGFIQAWQILQKEKPDIILSFGGYIALPVAIVSYFLKIPVFTHEQTIRPGLANRLIGFIAKKIFLSFVQTKRYFNTSKVILTGNPVRTSIFKVVKKPFDLKEEKPVIYVTGGSLGSHSINLRIKEILGQLLSDFIVIHQTGDTKEYHDFETLENVKKSLPEKLQNNYYLAKHFFDDEVGYVFQTCDFMISRAGANTFFELIKLAKPAIFIPLPWSANKEQQVHAQIFQENKTGEIYNQSEPSRKLLELIYKMKDNLETYKKNFKNFQNLYKQDAAAVITHEIQKANF